jgi:hypothetical protein
MFQYAAGLGVARRLDAPLFLDATWFDPRAHPPESPPARRYELGAFGISDAFPLRARLRTKLRGLTVFGEAAFGYQEDMLVMTRCSHQIIANSSFSWWGAWLASASEKIVVAPARWFNDVSLDTSDLIPDDWLRI